MSSNASTADIPEPLTLSDGVIGLELSQAPRAAATGEGTPELTVVVPSYNERDNVEELIARLAAALDGIAWEVVYVDDDLPDGTASSISRRLSSHCNSLRSRSRRQ